MLVAVLLAAGCGQRFDRAPGNAPTPGDLAADALAALEDAGSAHFVADVKTEESGMGFPFAVHLEGDASSTAVAVDGSVSFGGATFQGRLLADSHAFFIEFMGQWYGDEHGILDALAEAKKEHDGAVWDELATPDGLRRNFGELFDGEVTEGPDVDGAATWQFEGRLDADGVLEFGRRFEAEPSDRELEELRLFAERSRFVLVVGQDDHLPRRLELSLELTEEDLEHLEDASSFREAGSFKASLELSEFGKPVDIQAPADFKPLDQLFQDLFAGFE
jgi:hypothetical protein